jgi:hypothetical protein
MKPAPPSEALGMRPPPLRVRRPSRALAAFLAACLGAALGCAGARDAASRAGYTLNPFGSTDVAVNAVSALGPYLLVEVVGRKERLRLLVPASPACAEMLQPEAQLRYQKEGLFGRLQRDGESCDPDGVASLVAWRSRQPRHRAGTQVIPRATARFALVHETERHLLVRGRFPLASRIGIPAGFDLVALLPANAVCRAAAARGEASLEFRPAGNDVFRLLAGGEACVIEGFARPIDAAAERAQRLPGSSGVKSGS